MSPGGSWSAITINRWSYRWWVANVNHIFLYFKAEVDMDVYSQLNFVTYKFVLFAIE